MKRFFVRFASVLLLAGLVHCGPAYSQYRALWYTNGDTVYPIQALYLKVPHVFGSTVWGQIDSIPPALDSLVSPATGSGLYLDSTHLGYYSGGAWKTYMDNKGDFYLGGTSGALQWNGSTLSISATLSGNGGGITNINGGNIQTGTITATQISSGYVYAGTINASQVNAGTLTGITVQSSSGSNRIVLNNGNQLQYYWQQGANPAFMIGSMEGSTGAMEIDSYQDPTTLTNYNIILKPATGLVAIDGSVDATVGFETNGTVGYLSSSWGTIGSSIGTIGTTSVFPRTLTINGTTVTVLVEN